MKFWKIGLGVGAACAACCAIPLLGVAGLAGAAAAFSTALWACADELGLIALGVGAVGLAAFATWRRRQRNACAPQGDTCDCTNACSTAKIGT